MGKGGRNEEIGGGEREGKLTLVRGRRNNVDYHHFREVKEFMSGQPLIDFCSSPQYWRFLQWKYLEK